MPEKAERVFKGAANWYILGVMDFNIFQLFLILGVILVSMTFHEVMHGFVAYALGDDTAKLLGRLTLNPVKHIDPFLTILLPLMLALSGGPIFGGAKPVPFNPARLRYDEWGAALVAIAGPLTNFVIAFLAFGVYVLVGQPDDGILGSVLILFVYVNLGFFIFNLIPIPPLDGSRVLYALAPEFVRRGMEMIERYGIIIVFLIILLTSQYLIAFMSSAMSFFVELFSRIFGVA